MNAESILRDLVERDPVQRVTVSDVTGETEDLCDFCDSEFEVDYERVRPDLEAAHMVPANHLPGCLWRRAHEWVAAPVNEVTVWECVACEGRGTANNRVRHLITCPDGTELRRLTFPVGDGPSPSPI